jgi:gamma-glutamyltranspeptidase / glutathione hydrolase
MTNLHTPFHTPPTPTSTAVAARLAGLAGFAGFALLALCLPLSAAARETASAPHVAAVATPDEFGSRAAIEVLRHGGNAVDAAVATAFVLAVTYRETAPAAATRDMFLDEKGDVIKDASLVGTRAAGIPGTVAGLWVAHQRYGKRPWRELLQPAIRLARSGYIPTPEMLKDIQDERHRFAGVTNFDQYFGHLPSGEIFRQPELAATLERIAAGGPNGFYHGRTAQLLVAQMQHGGLITEKDLAGYQPRWREPLTAQWRGMTLLTAPLPSSGGFALIELLKMHDALGAQFAGLVHNSTQYVHLIAEMEKRVFADRAEYLGDPDFVQVPIGQLIDPAYIARRAAEVRVHEISPVDSVKPGLQEGAHTTHFSILDADGNAVSNTYTLNDSLGDGVVVEGAGFLLNDEMDDFSVKPGAPNFYGAVGGSANAIAPGKRMLSSMTPTIVLQGDKVALVLGSPGGTTIFTSVFQAMLNIYDFHMSAQDAAAAGRFHHQLLPRDVITYRPTPLPACVRSATSPSPTPGNSATCRSSPSAQTAR